MILISQDKKTVISLSAAEMFQIREKTIVNEAGINHFYTIRIYPTLNDYFNTKAGKMNCFVEMADYTKEERAISALEKIINYRYSDSVYTFPPNVDASLEKAKTAINKYSNTSHL